MLVIKNLSLRRVSTYEGKKYHPVTSHHAVSIRPGRHACLRARALGGNRILSRHAPMLPLEGCDTANCACRYRHHEDRRQTQERRAALSVTGKLFTDEDRRTLPERRRTKQAKGQSYFEYSAGD